MFQVVWLQTALDELAAAWMRPRRAYDKQLPPPHTPLINSCTRIHTTKANLGPMVNTSCSSRLSA